MNRNVRLQSILSATLVGVGLSGPIHGGAGPSGTGIDVTEISVHASVSRFGGVLGAAPYQLTLEVEGTGVVSASVTTPNGWMQALSYDPGDDQWSARWSDFDSLATMAGAGGPGFGTFIIELVDGSASVETATVDYDPSTTPPFPGYADVTSPLHNQTGVALDPTLTWTCSGGTCGPFAWYMELTPIGGSGTQSFEANILDPTVMQWTPGCLSPSTQYEFWISSGAILGSATQATAPGGDSYEFYAGWESVNETHFSTQAASFLASASFRNQGSNPAVFTASPPVLGTTWSASVGLSTGHDFARVHAFASPAAITLSGGQILLGGSKILFKLPVSPGPAPAWTKTVPNDCSLAGFPFTTQAVLFGGVTPFALTNAQDLVIGH